jgi:8-oxo-dGTP pyrophosphatase MutT (NUDIX family)
MFDLSVIIFRNTEGRILLQFRDSGAPSTALGWSFFGGRAEDDESAEDAVVREIKEELDMDIDISDCKLIAKEPWDGPVNGPRTVYLYEYKKPIDWRDIAVREGAGCAFLEKEEIGEMETVSGFAKEFVSKFVI